MTSPYLRVDELTDYLKFQRPAQARAWIRFAGVPTKRVGRGLRVHKDHVEAAISSADGKYHDPNDRRALARTRIAKGAPS